MAVQTLAAGYAGKASRERDAGQRRHGLSLLARPGRDGRQRPPHGGRPTDVSVYALLPARVLGRDDGSPERRPGVGNVEAGVLPHHFQEGVVQLVEVPGQGPGPVLELTGEVPAPAEPGVVVAHPDGEVRPGPRGVRPHVVARGGPRVGLSVGAVTQRAQLHSPGREGTVHVLQTGGRGGRGGGRGGRGGGEGRVEGRLGPVLVDELQQVPSVFDPRRVRPAVSHEDPAAVGKPQLHRQLHGAQPGPVDAVDLQAAPHAGVVGEDAQGRDVAALHAVDKRRVAVLVVQVGVAAPALGQQPDHVDLVPLHARVHQGRASRAVLSVDVTAVTQEQPDDVGADVVGGDEDGVDERGAVAGVAHVETLAVGQDGVQAVHLAAGDGDEDVPLVRPRP